MLRSNRACDGDFTPAGLLAVALFGFATCSHAEPTLRYNYLYVCDRGLRIVVGHCRHDSDTPDMPPTRPEDDYCQIYYPDRPKTGGIEAMEVVLRADLLQSLQACGALGAATSESSARPGAAAATSAPSGTGRQFCAQLLQLRSLTADGFRSIDRGPAAGKGPDIHAASVMLASAADCYIRRTAGKPASYACTWKLRDATAEAQFKELGTAVARCLNNEPDWTFMEASGAWDAITYSNEVAFDLTILAEDEDTMILSVEPFKFAAAAGTRNQAPRAESPPREPTAPAAPGGRPVVQAMPIGPPMCPLLRRLEALAHEDFRSIDIGPDRAFGKSAGVVHRTSMPIPGAKCYIDHDPGRPGKQIAYTCQWPSSKDVEDQFVSMVQALEKCTGGTADSSLVTEIGMPDVTMTLRSVEYHTQIVNDWLSLDVHLPKP